MKVEGSKAKWKNAHQFLLQQLNLLVLANHLFFLLTAECLQAS